MINKKKHKFKTMDWDQVTQEPEIGLFTFYKQQEQKELIFKAKKQDATKNIKNHFDKTSQIINDYEENSFEKYQVANFYQKKMKTEAIQQNTISDTINAYSPRRKYKQKNRQKSNPEKLPHQSEHRQQLSIGYYNIGTIDNIFYDRKKMYKTIEQTQQVRKNITIKEELKKKLKYRTIEEQKPSSLKRKIKKSLEMKDEEIKQYEDSLIINKSGRKSKQTFSYLLSEDERNRWMDAKKSSLKTQSLLLMQPQNNYLGKIKRNKQKLKNIQTSRMRLQLKDLIPISSKRHKESKTQMHSENKVSFLDLGVNHMESERKIQLNELQKVKDIIGKYFNSQNKSSRLQYS